MKLLYSPASPYARKVRIVALEKGVDIEIVRADPLSNPPELQAANPLGKVPALILDDGSSLYDSPVICEYLDSLSPHPQLIPPPGASRWQVLRLQALADGVMDAAVSTMFERRRPEHERSSSWPQRWRDAIERSIAEIERELPALSPAFDLAQISIVCALGYLEFRLPEIEWQPGAPQLDAWWRRARERASVVASQPT